MDEEDFVELGAKIVGMADRVRAMDMACPGAQARWHFEMDDVRYRVVLSVAGPAGQDGGDA